MKKEALKFLTISSIVLMVLVFLVLAVAGDEVLIVSPTSGTNFTSITGVIFNVSFVNGSDITNPQNATFYLNISGSWQQIGNTSISNGCNVGATVSSCSANITNTSITDGVYSLNSTIYNGSGTISVTHSANLSSQITIDNTPPQIFTSNISSPLPGSNHSSDINGLLVLNTSVLDITIGTQTVFFNITNGTGSQNATFTATNPTENYWNATLNTTHFPDGNYTITVFANDSLNNLNNSASVTQVIFDNTNPGASASCSPNSISKGSNLPCTCSGSDTTSGVSSTSGSSTSPDGTGIQDRTGVFTYTCSVTDRAGNNAKSSLQYTVEGSGPPGGSSSGGGGSSSSSSSANTENSTNSTEEPQEPATSPELEETQTTSERSDTEAGQSLRGTTPGGKIGWIIAIVIMIAAIAIAYFVRKKSGLHKLHKKAYSKS